MFKLALFDLDGTLKWERDPYSYIHRALGVPYDPQLVHAGLSGAIPYDEWLRRDVASWRGTPRAVIETLLHDIPYLPGARELVAFLKAHQVEVAIVSSGLHLHALQVAEELGIELAFGNEIFFVDSEHGPVVSGEVGARIPLFGKDQIARALQAQLAVAPEHCIAVGDSSGDIPLFGCAGFSVAVNPSNPRVAEAADLVIPDADLRPVLKAFLNFFK
ncbi:MAG: HAD family phosphatase [Anaerolineae bacterium]|nr:HAD family phosphatase [Anaerolineae bacterium]